MGKYTMLRFVLFWIGVWFAGVSCFANDLRERAYVQTDKQFYLSGELVWMKFIATDENGAPLPLSKVGYVELLDSSAVLSHAKLELKEGLGEGCLVLPPNLPSGNYRLVAYTRYMRNEGEAVFFEKPISVVNTFMAAEGLATDSLLPAYSFKKKDNPIGLSPDRMEYGTRMEGEVRLEGMPENIHTLSVSIAGIDLYQPSSQTGIDTWKEWIPSLSGQPFDGKIIPEYEGPIITGKMINMNTGEMSSEEAPRALLGYTGEDIRLFGGQMDEKGEVTFFTRGVSGGREAVTAVYLSGKTPYRLDIEEPFVKHEAKVLPLLRLNPGWQEELVKRSVGLQVLHAYAGDSLVREKKEKPWLQRVPDASYLLDEYTRFGTMEEVVIEFIVSLRFRRIEGNRVLSVLTEERTGFTVGNSLILLDGIPISDHEVIFRYDPLKIRKIDIYRGKYVFGGQLFDGIAFFSTYHSDYPGLSIDKSTQFFDFEGTQAPRIFYMPSYQTEAQKQSRVPDYRHTLLWKPEVRTDGQSSVMIPFTTSDLTGDFVITVEGVTKDGKVISATGEFRVK